MVNISQLLYNLTESATASTAAMPQELPPLPFGNIAAYKRARKGSGLSDEELLEEQAGMERRIAKKAAVRGVTLIGAAVVRQRNVAAATASAASAAATASAAVSVSAAAAAAAADAAVVERAAAVSSRGRPLIERRQWPEA